jgi:cytochrome c oxidase subunit 3
VLLSSGVMLTYAHRALTLGAKFSTVDGLLATILYGLIFSVFQIIEYTYTDFSIQDSIYGSLFYICTGFHGFHVLIGTILLIVCLNRTLKNHFTQETHLGFEAAA